MMMQFILILIGITGFSYCLLSLRDNIVDVYICYKIKAKQNKAIAFGPGCSCDPRIGENCELCQPAGVPEWLTKEPESYGYKNEPEEGSRDD